MNNRKSMTFGAAVVGVMLALASVAMACTTFKGRFDVTAGGATSSAWGDSSSGMLHCTGTYAPQSNASVPTTGGTITVSAVPTTAGVDGCSTSKLSDTQTSKNKLIDRHYFIYYVNRNGFVDSSGVWKWQEDCMAGTGSTKLSAADGKGDEIIVTNGQTGTRQYTIPTGQQANSATDRAGVCISDTGAGQGNQTPLAII